MPRFLHLSKKKIKCQNNAGWFKLTNKTGSAKILIIAAIAIFGVGYLIEINSLATKGYQIRELERQITELKQAKSDLELEALSLQSMGAVRDRLAQADMVKSEGIDYLAATPVAYAR